ncbi:MAG: hypothetical protein ACOVKF_02955, partial [Limnohabitans sp.]
MRTNTIEFGASNVQAFIGVGGPYIQDSNRDGYVTDHDVIEGGVLYKADPINTSAIGIVVNDLEFGMSILTTQAPDLTNPKSILVPEGTKFTAMRATGKQIAMVGLPKELEFSFEDVLFELNQSDQDGMIVDFTDGGKSQGMAINTGNPNRPMVLDFKEDMLTASIGYARINVAGVLALEGGITLQRRTMNDAEIYIAGIAMPMGIVGVDALVLGGRNISAFAGIKGPYVTDKDKPNDPGYHDTADEYAAGDVNKDAIGFAIVNLDFGMVLANPSFMGQSLDQLYFVGITASADFAGLVGTEPYVTLNAKDIRFGLNMAIANGFPLPLTFVDFSTVNDGGAPGMDIPIGANNSINMAELNNFEVRIGMQANLGL